MCAKFRTESRTPESPGLWQAQWRRGSKDVIGGEILRKGSAAGLETLSADEDTLCQSDSKSEGTVLIVMDMQEDGGECNPHGAYIHDSDLPDSV